MIEDLTNKYEDSKGDLDKNTKDNIQEIKQCHSEADENI